MSSIYKVSYITQKINKNSGKAENFADNCFWYTNISIAEIPSVLLEKFKDKNVCVEILRIEKVQGHL